MNDSMMRIHLITVFVLGTVIVLGSMVAYGSSKDDGFSHQKNDACYNAGFSDGRAHPYKGVALMAGLTTKGSCQVAFRGMGEIIFHAKS
jgi:hypothetical protein